MKCSRRWEVEAARDGRLGERELASHARHLLDCTDCRREQRELTQLSEGLRALARGEGDELGLRRGRRALLERALAQGRASPPRTTHRRALFAACAVAALALLTWWRLDPHQPAQIVIEAARGAAYERYEVEGRPVIELRSGRLTLKVARKPGEPRLRVLTPDGEVEDVGTTFSVEVRAGRTERVEVSRGQVLVHVAGQRTRLIEAGQHHEPYAHAPEMAAAGPSEPAAIPAPSAEPAPPAAHAKAVAAHARPTAKHAQRSGEAAAADDDSPSGQAFAEALRTLDRGEAAEAARRFKAFALSFPDDRRVEDAGYLRVVAWLRAGRAPEARSAAAEFLRRYPNGFRRHDVERLLAR